MLENEEFMVDEGIDIQGILDEPVDLNEVEEEQPPDDTVEKEEKTVPLTALQKEREKLRNLKKDYSEAKEALERIMKSSGVRNSQELMSRIDDITMREYVQNHGMNEQAARVFLTQQKEIEELKRTQKHKDYASEIQTLANQSFYADIDNVADEVIEYAQDRGITAKEAYNVLFAEQRAEELSRQAEFSAALSEKQKQSRKIPALSSLGGVASRPGRLNLSSNEIAAAKAAGIDPVEYAKYKNMKQ